MKKYQIAIFDVDGTLLDTTRGLLLAIQYVIDKNGFRALNEDEISRFKGAPIKSFLKDMYNLPDDRTDMLVNEFRNRYKDVDLLKAVPYDGIYNVLDTLKSADIKIAVATYKRQDYATAILEHFHFNDYSDVLNGSDFESRLKKVDIIRKCMDDLGVSDYKDAVMIGDSMHDAIGACEIGMDFIGVTYGYGFKSDEDVKEYNNVGIAHTPEELLKFLVE